MSKAYGEAELSKNGKEFYKIPSLVADGKRRRLQ
jgi:hypothetical protein